MRIRDVALGRRLKRLRALLLDVDGVLTDGGMYYSDQGEAMKKFNTKDGMGIARLRDRGIKIGLITGEDTEIVNRRAEKLRIDDVYKGVDDKVAAVKDFLGVHGLTPDETGYVGDDVNDLGAMKFVAVSFAVADAVNAVREAAHLVTESKGGEGAVREIAELILRHQA